MRTVLTFILLAVSLFHKPLHASNEVPFHLVNGLIIVEVVIDHKPMPFIFDSGADELIVASELDGDPTVKFETLSGEVESKQIIINELRIGNSIELFDMEAFTMPLYEMNAFTSLELGGILSGKILEKGNITIDFENQRLIMNEAKRSDYTTAITIDQGLIFTEVELDGQRLTFLVDTGASCHIVGTAIFNQFSDIPNEVQNSSLVDAGGKKADIKTFYNQVKLGGLILNEQKMLVQELDELSNAIGRKVDGILSVSQLNLAKISFDYVERVMNLNI